MYPFILLIIRYRDFKGTMKCLTKREEMSAKNAVNCEFTIKKWKEFSLNHFKIHRLSLKTRIISRMSTKALKITIQERKKKFCYCLVI